MAAIARFGTRMVPEREQIIRECKEKGQLVQGPHIALFEEEFRQFLGGSGHVRAVSTKWRVSSQDASVTSTGSTNTSACGRSAAASA